MVTASGRDIRVTREPGYWRGSFRAMASPCEILLAITSVRADEVREVVEKVAGIAWQVEEKFSRYRGDNIVHRINTSDGIPIRVDDETARLLDFSETLYRLSGGRFDITSGVLREAWHFDGSDRVPSRRQVAEIMPRIGWHRVVWQPPEIRLAPGMQIDLGGIGKEYAVDQAAQAVRSMYPDGCLINFGGDLALSRPRSDGSHWQVGMESAARGGSATEGMLRLKEGAIATSGDARRYLLKDGIRYSHVLDPATGWPVLDAPRSVTVASETCIQAGMLATLAMLRGAQAEAFLDEQGVRYWAQR